MRFVTAAVLLTFAASLGLAAEPNERVKKLLTSKDYTVAWGEPRRFDADAVLELGGSGGHGGNLNWMRFLPTKDGVEVLDIKLELGRKQYATKWPEDRAPVTVKRAVLPRDKFAALLADLAIVDAAKLEPPQRDGAWSSSGNFWVHVQLAAGKTRYLDMSWAGYSSGTEEPKYAPAVACSALARDAVAKLKSENHKLTDAERRWTSDKFLRLWKSKDDGNGWWVRERAIITVGVIGDATVLPVLRDVIADGKDRNVYYAINAVTRLTGKDVREKPVEDMDLEKVRPKVLQMLKELE